MLSHGELCPGPFIRVVSVRCFSEGDLRLYVMCILWKEFGCTMQSLVPTVTLSLICVSLRESHWPFAEFLNQCYLKTSAIDGTSHPCMLSVIIIELVDAYNSPCTSTMVDRQIHVSIKSDFNAGALRLAFLRAACRTSPSPHSSTRLACEVNPLPTIPLSFAKMPFFDIKDQIQYPISQCPRSRGKRLPS